MIKARVHIETARKRYRPGEVIHEPLSDADMVFLRKHGFIFEESDSLPDAVEDDALNGDGTEHPTYIPGIQNPGEGGEDGAKGAEYKDEAALKKMNKDEIVAYAKSIGLAMDQDKLKNDMIDSVLNYIEERIAEAEQDRPYGIQRADG